MDIRFWAAAEFLIAFLAFVQGVFAVFAPRGCIHFFQKLCFSLNWKVEPADWDKELRNTKLLGVLLIVLALMIFLAALLRPKIFLPGCFA
ncbi:MAG TPA: hypothetical protein PKL97_03890 [Candidatus Omnitrophota bacterium]|nr:hypothetical protein [Candidatus Omnitrophota bacterium]